MKTAEYYATNLFFGISTKSGAIELVQRIQDDALIDGRAKPNTELNAEEGKWAKSLGIDFDTWTKREVEIAHAAFIAGWYYRTGHNPYVTA